MTQQSFTWYLRSPVLIGDVVYVTSGYPASSIGVTGTQLTLTVAESIGQGGTFTDDTLREIETRMLDREWQFQREELA